jgi:uncharacterized membrane protein
VTRDPAGGREPDPAPGLASRRIARVGIGATAGLVVGTVAQVATGDPLWSAVGAAVGAVGGVLMNRWPRRRRR